MDILIADQITKTYAQHRALNQVSINVPEASIYGLLGPNGAGKTTLIRIINQITAPDSGIVIFDGKPLQPLDVQHIGYLPEERGLYKKMEVGEQSLYLAQLKGLSKADARKQLKDWFEKFEIQNWWNKKVEELSKGMAQKVQFIVTILHKPKLLIFDEPFSGFDPINTELLKNEILNLQKQGSTVIFSTHNMSSVEEICDHIALINKSNKILEGKVSEIRNSYKSNNYEIIYKTIHEDFHNVLAQNFNIIESQKHELGQRSIVKLTTDQEVHQFLQATLQQAHLSSFKELIPSMNEIFIQKVTDNK